LLIAFELWDCSFNNICVVLYIYLINKCINIVIWFACGVMDREIKNSF
jgi:hypothetical protein